jgi:hypothetical protein
MRFQPEVYQSAHRHTRYVTLASHQEQDFMWVVQACQALLEQHPENERLRLGAADSKLQQAMFATVLDVVPSTMPTDLVSIIVKFMKRPALVMVDDLLAAAMSPT